MKAEGFIPLKREKTCLAPVLERTIYRSPELTMSFRERKNMLFVLGAKDFFNHIGGFSLTFMVYPHEHFSEKTHSNKLDTDDDQEGTE